MPEDRFGNPLSTTSAAARDAYVEGCDLQLALWAGADAAFARATENDPGFALAHVGAALVAAGRGDGAAAQASLASARSASGLSAREAAHVGFFALMLSGQSAEATAAGRAHLGQFPRDAMVMNNYATIIGLLGLSGRPGCKREQELAFDYFAPHWGEEWSYLAQHSMALLEVGRLDEAEARNERAIAINPRNLWSAHSRGHIAYERGDYASTRPYMRDFLADCPPSSFLYGHLAWHLALADLFAGDSAAAWQGFSAAVAPGRHTGGPRTQVTDAAQFLWRWELAGHQRDREAWAALDRLTARILPHAGSHFPDWHAAIADASAGNAARLEALIAEMDERMRLGRYPEGGITQQAARGFAAFAAGDWAGAIARLRPLLAESERLGGSRAQLDIVEFTVLRACIEAGRHDEMKAVLSARRGHIGPVPVAGVH